MMTSTTTTTTTIHRDLEVYSRQRLVVGEHGLQLLLHSSLCIVGLDGLGAEIAKNSLLAGVPKVILCDGSPVNQLDLSNNICLRNKPLEEFKGTRAEECAKVLQQFNPSSTLIPEGDITPELLQSHSPGLVVVCNKPWSSIFQLEKICRDVTIPIIVAFTGGLYFSYGLNLGEHNYLGVIPFKDKDIRLFDIVFPVETEEKPSSKNEDNSSIGGGEEKEKIEGSNKERNVSDKEESNEGKDNKGSTEGDAKTSDTTKHGAPEGISKEDRMEVDSTEDNSNDGDTSEGNSKEKKEGEGEGEGKVEGEGEGEGKGEGKGESKGKGDGDGESEAEEKGEEKGESKGEGGGDGEGKGKGEEKGEDKGKGDGEEKGEEKGEDKGESKDEGKDEEKGEDKEEEKGEVEVEAKVEVKETTTSFTASYSDDALPLFEGDEVELISKIGVKIGKGKISSVDSEKSILSISCSEKLKELDTEIFIQYSPQHETATYPKLVDSLAEGDETVKRLANGLQALEKFRVHHNRLPTPRDTNDFNEFFGFLEEPKEESFFRAFCDTSFASISPIDTVAGGLIGEQIVKILSHCFAPIQHWVGMDFFEYLYEEGLTVENCTPDNSHFGCLNASQIRCFGKSFQEKLTSSNVLVVGAGALGNEFVKGAAMAGIGTEPSASLVVVDNDLVMTSNLSRQMCFTDANTNKPKATTLAKNAKQLFNATTNIIPVVLKLDHTTEDELNRKIKHTTDLSQIDLCVTALDNIPARNTVERISQMWNKPMVNGATEGFEGQQNNFVTGVTDEYYDATAESMAAPVSCTPKVLLQSKDDVIHNAKIHYENMVKKMHEEGNVSGAEHLKLFLHDIRSVSDENTPNKPVINKKLLEVEITTEQKESFLSSVKELLEMNKKGTLEMFFDKDNVHHVKQMQSMCNIVASIHKIPVPNAMEIRRKAGSIIPSIISTTAVISGFMLLNSLQIARSKNFKFFNIMYDQAEIMRTIPATRNPERQSIFLYKKLEVTTKFSDILQIVKSTVPTVSKLTIFGDAKVETQEVAPILKERVLDFVSKHVILGGRRHFVMEVLFESVVKEGNVRKLVKATKFVVVFLPDPDTLAYVRDCITSERQLAEVKQHNNEIEEQLKISTSKVAQLEKNAQKLRKELRETNANVSSLEQQLKISKASELHLKKTNKSLEGEVKALKPYHSIFTTIYSQLQSVIQLMSGAMSRSVSTAPLSLGNQGNTCFLASMTQVLFAAHVSSGNALFEGTTSRLGKCFEQLFKLRGREQWNAVVSEFFSVGAPHGFRLGKQDDSAKAFKLVMEQEWPNPAVKPDVHVLLLEATASACKNCDTDRKANRSEKTYIQYAGNDQPDADIGEEYSLQESFSHPCSCDKEEIHEKCEYYRWPPVLFMTTTSSREFLRAASRGAKFRLANGEFVKYSLLAASIHGGGSTNGGHYTAVSKLDGKWYSSSDSYSSQIDFSQFISHDSSYEDLQLLAFYQDK